MAIAANVSNILHPALLEVILICSVNAKKAYQTPLYMYKSIDLAIYLRHGQNALGVISLLP
jgi:hypothetical protein